MRPFFTALACLWAALLLAAIFSSRQHPSSHWIMTAALPAFLIEAIFYLGSLFESARDWLIQRMAPRRLALLLWGSALLPYLVFAMRSGTLQRNALWLLAVLTGMLSFWHVVFPRRLTYDAGFLVIAAAPLITRVFSRIYVSPEARISIDILGHLMWIRLGIAALLILREWNPGAFGLWPRAREWRLGLFYYLGAIVPLAALALALHDVRFSPPEGAWWRTAALGVGTFFGILWVVAISEEFFFRGVIERALFHSSGSRVVAVAVSAVLFGCAHLWFHQFPNWQRASVATVLGVVCGLAYLRTDSVRAPMVTHAFVVTTWRVLFNK